MMKRLCTLLLIGWGFLSVELSAASPTESGYLRVRRDLENRPRAMETAIAHFVGAKGVSVDLIGAVHVGEKSYYDSLNETFRHYDAVLYELIAPEDRLVPKADGPKSMVSQFQDSIKNFLALEFQLEQIDYSAKNMVHADVTPDVFFQSLHQKGQGIWTMLGKLVLESLTEQQEDDPVQQMKLLLLLLRSDSKAKTYQLRAYLAENFGKVDDVVERLEGPIGEAIIANRNAKALSVLREQIRSGKKHFAIFYGAAHMPNMEEHLLKDFHFKRQETRWLPAWWLAEPDVSSQK